MTRLEVIKTNMEENIKVLIRLQEEQLKAYEEILKNALGKEFEELTEAEQMVLTMKGALNKVKNTDNETEKAFYGALIGKLSIDLKEMGISFN